MLLFCPKCETKKVIAGRNFGKCNVCGTVLIQPPSEESPVFDEDSGKSKKAGILGIVKKQTPNQRIESRKIKE